MARPCHTNPRRSLFRLGGLLLVAACTTLGACQSASQSPGCPQDLPTACPAAVPSYQQEVAPLIARECATCHGPGGVESQRDLSTYTFVYANRSPVLNQIYACIMPPSGAAALQSADRLLLLTWLVCGSPNN